MDVPFETELRIVSREPTARELSVTNDGMKLFERDPKTDDAGSLIVWLLQATSVVDDLYFEQCETELWARNPAADPEEILLNEIAANRLRNRVKRLELLIGALEQRLVAVDPKIGRKIL